MQTIDLHPQLLLAYTEVSDGNMDERFADKAVVMSNRRKIYNHFDLNPRQVIEAKQIHSDRILILNSENTKMWVGMNIPGVDGFIIDQKDAAILLKVADCVPVVIYDPTHHVVGLFHAGWQGAVKQIHLKGLGMMTNTFQTNPADVLVWLGPSAHNCCFFTPDSPQQLDDPSWAKFITQKDNKYYIDIPGFIVDTLKLSGVNNANISVDSRCTVEDHELFSHTRFKQTGANEGRILVLTKLR